jgi:glycosyltransferase involved in cell wall biosynthesis
MRVMYILSELCYSGAERMLACSYEEWRAAGVDPVVVGMAEGEHPFAPVLAGAGYEVVLLPGVRSVSGLSALKRALRVHAPDVVHIHQEGGFDAVALLCARSPTVGGVVRTVQGNFRFGGSLRLRRKARVAFARRLGVVWIACSQEVAETERSYSARGVDGVVENWVDVDGIAREATVDRRSATRRALGIGSYERVVITVGNCSPIKNHELLAVALAGLDFPVVVLHVGDQAGASTSELAAWGRLERHHRVHHLGARGDVAQLLTASDLFAFPSLHEGLGLASVEAVCAGLPVLAPDAPGLRWLASFPSASLLPFESKAWTIALARVLEQGVDKELTEVAAASARVRFGPQLGVSKYLAAYQAAVQCGIRSWPIHPPIPQTL